VTTTSGLDAGVAVAEELDELVALLAQAPAEVWDSMSLCSGWRVREVVAHMTMPGRYSSARFLLELARSRGRFNQMADRCARRDAGLEPGELLSALTSRRMKDWTPPGGGFEGALTHAVIHGLDITVPAGLSRRVPVERLALVLDGLTQGKSLKHFGLGIDGVQLRATDMDWSFGSGAAVAGEGQDLALALCGRRVGTDRLTGPGTGRLTTR
jgi:uncharacterized protein (TIGR03083 family)